METVVAHLPLAVSDATVVLGLSRDEEGDVLETIYVMGGCLAYTSNENEECREVSDHNWAYFPQRDHEIVPFRRLPTPSLAHTAASVDGAVWTVLNGGTVAIYETLQDEWTVLDGQLPDRRNAASFVVGTTLYVVGGFDVDDNHDDDDDDDDEDENVKKATGVMIAIDTIASRETGRVVVSERAPLPTPRGDAGAAVMVLEDSDDGTLRPLVVVAGGMTHRNQFCAPLSTVELYNPLDDTWSTSSSSSSSVVEPLSVARAAPSVLFVHGRLVVLGGATTHLDEDCDGTVVGGPPDLHPVDSAETLEFGVSSKKQSSSSSSSSSSSTYQWKLSHFTNVPDVFRTAAVEFPGDGLVYSFGGVTYHDDDGDSDSDTDRNDDDDLVKDDDLQPLHSYHPQEPHLRPSDAVTTLAFDRKRGIFVSSSKASSLVGATDGSAFRAPFGGGLDGETPLEALGAYHHGGVWLWFFVATMVVPVVCVTYVHCRRWFGYRNRNRNHNNEESRSSFTTNPMSISSTTMKQFYRHDSVNSGNSHKLDVGIPDIKQQQQQQQQQRRGSLGGLGGWFLRSSRSYNNRNSKKSNNRNLRFHYGEAAVDMVELSAP